MREKWNVKKKGFLKIHIAVYVKTKKIFSMKVTDEHVHDSKVLLDLVNDIVKSNKIIGKLYHLAYVPELCGLFFSIF
jgi:hypothetical protein